METVSIYALCEPGTRTLRYLGASYRVKRRLWEHWTKSRKQNNHLGHWLSSLSECPTLITLREVPENEWQEWERCYICNARMLGFKLVNGTDGGDGVDKGAVPWNKGKKASPIAVEKNRQARTGKRYPQETKEKHTRAQLNKKMPSNTSGFAGVFWEKPRKKWTASININSKTVYRKSFSKIEDAVFARALVLTSKDYGTCNN